MDQLTITEQKTIIPSGDVKPEKIPSMYNMDVNYSNQNKWFAQLALEDVLGNGY